VHRDTLALLACPSCRRGYVTDGVDARGNGALTCPGCGVQVPILAGFPLFGEAALTLPSDLHSLERRLFGDLDAYEAYARDKAARGTLESYAAFHPFNEATRALEPALVLFDAHLKPEDVVLDLWCRTGWSGEHLAARYPDNRVVSVWEGDNSVLGYRGFRRWLGEGRRAPNLDVVFTDPRLPLPFADEAFAAIHAPDCLHRYPLIPFAGECLRVARQDAVLLFPHVHLANAEPVPWFDRGGTIRPGTDYRAWIDRLEGRGGRVLSEAGLFDGGAVAPFADTPDTPHYNGFVIVAPDAALSAAPTNRPAPRPERLLLNPLFRLHLARGTARVDASLHDGAGEHLFLRHPIYRRRLPTVAITLDEDQVLLLALAATGMRLSDLEALVETSGLAPLIEADLLVPTDVSAAMHALQRFHANQHPTFEDLAAHLTAQSAVILRTREGDELTGAEAAELIKALREEVLPQDAPAVLRFLQALDGRPMTFGADLPLALLIDAAHALRPTAAANLVPISDPTRPSEFLRALVGLVRGDILQFSA
jgi:uncharacterized protein YbaR (Trm112 family)